VTDATPKPSALESVRSYITEHGNPFAPLERQGALDDLMDIALDLAELAALREDRERLEKAMEYLSEFDCENPPSLDNWSCGGCWACSAKKWVNDNAARRAP
jgi:hypothetical protein